VITKPGFSADCNARLILTCFDAGVETPAPPESSLLHGLGRFHNCLPWDRNRVQAVFLTVAEVAADLQKIIPLRRTING